jgi:hypothetical protein
MNDTRSMTRARRISARIAVVLCLVLVVGMLPAAALAAPKTVSDREASYLNSATISLMATGGIDKTYYQLDNGASTVGTSVTTGIYGAHFLKFWSVDTTGVAETPVTTPFFVDENVLPTLGTDCKASYTVTATIEMTATDNFNGSGVDFMCYRVDGGRISTVVSAATKAATKLLFARMSAMKLSAIVPASAVDPSQTPPHEARGACSNCHDIITPEPTSTPNPDASVVSRTIVVTGVGTHKVEFWAQDVARNVMAHVVKSFAIAPASTSVSLKASATSLRLGKYVTLTARLSGGAPAGTSVRFEARRPGSSSYALLSSRGVSATGAASYRYKLAKKGTYYFRVRFMGITNFAASTSKLVKVVVK